MENKFKGLWPAMFTPVQEDGNPNYDQLEKLIELLISQNLDGLYILGSTGQGILFTEEQRKEITEFIRKVVNGRIPIIVQVGALTTAESVRLAKHAEKCGVEGISSVGPIYFPGNADMALEHYKTIANSTNLPFFPYLFGDNAISGDVLNFIEKLLVVPNVTGMKLTTSQLLTISSIHTYAGNRLTLFSGSDELMCHASLCGTVGAIGTFYNLWGEQCKYVLNEFRNGNYELAKEFMLEFQRVILLVLPNIWPFLRKAMQLKYGIDIGQTKAPVGNGQKEWDDSVVAEILESFDSILAGKLEGSVKVG
jgi:N-acetylneuraminate lyase